MQQDEPKKFAILRTEKVKDLAELGGRGRHNSRADEKGTEHATKLAEIEQHNAEAVKDVEMAQKLRSYAEKDRQEAARVLSAADDTAAALSLGLDAIDAGELAHRPKTPEKPTEGLTLNKTPEPIIPRGEALSGWKSAVGPYWDALVGYARRFSQVKEREQQIQRDAATISAARTAQAQPVPPEIEEIKRRRRDRAQDQR